MIPFGQYGVEYENVTPAPKVGLVFFCTTICQGSAVRKVIYIYTVRKALLCTFF